MAFWNKKKKEKEKIEVKCKCGAKYEMDCDGLGTVETGYKGRLAFYAHCEECDNTIYFEEIKLPRRYIRRAYRNHIW